MALATLNDVRARTNSLVGNFEGRLRITDRLLFTSRFGIDAVNVREDQFESRLVAGSYASSADGVAKSGYTQANRYVIDNFATLSPNVGDRSDLSLTAGGSVEFNRSEFNFIRGEGFSNDHFTQVSNAAVLIQGQATNSKSNLASFFARGDYLLDRKYGLGVSLRTDGSSRFGPNDRWGTFPAVSASWLLSEEPFMKGRFFDYFKLRGELRAHRQSGHQRLSVPGPVRQRQLRRHARHLAEQPGESRPQVGNDQAVRPGPRHDLRPGPGEPHDGLLPQEDQRPAAQPADLGDVRLHQRVRQRRATCRTRASRWRSPR